MHHYDRDTLLQPLGIREDCQHLWRENIPREAIKHSFLMHGILALSALHIAHTRPVEADKYLRLCDKHQTKALEMFRTVLCTDITPEISTALFALSSTISILSMGRSCADAMSMPEPRYVSMEQVAELFLLTRGVRDLIHTCMEWVSSGPLGPMLDGHYIPDQHDVQLPVALQKQFINLQYMLEECCAVEYRPECERALRRLEDIYRNVLQVSATGEVETGQIWRWMLLVPCEFVTMIRACFPPALILLAHFAAVSLTVRKAWYTNDWGHYVLTGISMVLYGSDMYSYLDWPMEQARSNMVSSTIERAVRVTFTDRSIVDDFDATRGDRQRYEWRLAWCTKISLRPNAQLRA